MRALTFTPRTGSDSMNALSLSAAETLSFTFAFRLGTKSGDSFATIGYRKALAGLYLSQQLSKLCFRFI